MKTLFEKSEKLCSSKKSGWLLLLSMVFVTAFAFSSCGSSGDDEASLSSDTESEMDDVPEELRPFVGVWFVDRVGTVFFTNDQKCMIIGSDDKYGSQHRMGDVYEWSYDASRKLLATTIPNKESFYQWEITLMTNASWTGQTIGTTDKTLTKAEKADLLTEFCFILCSSNYSQWYAQIDDVTLIWTSYLYLTYDSRNTITGVKSADLDCNPVWINSSSEPGKLDTRYEMNEPLFIGGNWNISDLEDDYRCSIEYDASHNQFIVTGKTQTHYSMGRKLGKDFTMEMKHPYNYDKMHFVLHTYDSKNNKDVELYCFPKK